MDLKPQHTTIDEFGLCHFIKARCVEARNQIEACAGGISLWQRRGRRSLSDVETSSEEEEGVADLRKHTDSEDKVSAIVCNL